MSRKAQPPLINPVKAPATYELVVDQLRRALALGRFAPGDKLPPERELSEQLGVSRTTVREAVRVLEGEKVLAVSRGASGGIVVLDPGSDAIAEQIRSQTAELQQIYEFRLANECAAARLAAANHSREDARALRELIKALDENEGPVDDPDQAARQATEFGRLDNALHLAIAQASGNPFIVEAVETCRLNMLRPVGSVFSHTEGDVNTPHRRIVDAILAGDGATAERVMAEHIDETQRQLLKLSGLDGRKRKRARR
jgi:GntR family transcriptional regulator, transcriptional repressor for pyruvate dehydrogenase complex